MAVDDRKGLIIFDDSEQPVIGAKIKVSGGVTKLLGIVPALQPAHAMYNRYAVQAGLPVN